MRRLHTRENAPASFLTKPAVAMKQHTHGSTIKADRRHRPNRRRRSELVAGFSSTAVPVAESSAADGKIVCPLPLPARAAGLGIFVASSSGGRSIRDSTMQASNTTTAAKRRVIKDPGRATNSGQRRGLGPEHMRSFLGASQ